MPRVRTRTVLTGLIVLVTVLIFATGVSSAFASFGVYPSRIEVNAMQGETVGFTINTSTADVENPMRVMVSAWDFARNTRGEPQRISSSDAQRFLGCSSWLEWAPEFTILPPGEEGAFAFTATVPQGMEDGTHYCYVTFSATPELPDMDAPEGEQAMRTPIGFAVSALVLVSVGDTSAGTYVPTLDANAMVEAFDIKTFNFRDSIPMEVTLLNSGNVHLNMEDTCRIDISKGEHEIESIPVAPYTLLPENTLAIPAIWKPDSPIGVYKATFCADVGLDEPMLAERRFYVISWPFLVGFAASLLAVTLMLVLFFKRFKIRLAPRSEASSPEE